MSAKTTPKGLKEVTTQKLDNDLTMFGDKLSKTFNGITMS